MKFKLALLAAAIVVAMPATAKPFKWASAGEISTWDIHSQNNALQNGIHAAVYESLVYYNSKTFRVEPVLATSWQMVTPTQWRFNLRQNVKFSDGSALTADDVVFSLQRALAPTSNFAIYAQGIDRAVKVNDNTVDVILKGANPVLLNQLTELRIMSKAWAEKNNSVNPKDIRNVTQETFANRNAMGTGAYVLKEWLPDQRMVMTRNASWWGWAANAASTNVTEIIYTPIKSEATRVAAMLSGEVDLMLDPSPQDLPRLRSNANLKVMDGVENRTIFFGMDQFRDELTGSNIKGKNPLKDLRVRKALYHAIDSDTLTRVTMRGLAQPTGAMVAPMVAG
jgi:peptide/nickel transport system substrate-binding protein